MKTSKTFSIEETTATSLNDYCQDNKVDRNQFVENAIKKKLVDVSVTFIQCPVCQANYTSKLIKCPACELKLKSVSFSTEKQQRIDYQQHLIDRYNIALKDEVCDAERIAHLNERIKDCLAKIELTKTLKDENPV